jgi:hypothetical protein
MNNKIALLLVGLVIGGLVGFLTRPQATEIKLGPLSMEVQTDQTAAPGDTVTSGQWERIAIFSAIGALAGLGIGFVVARRRGG